MTEVAEQWKYGKEGQAYPVKPGDVWQVGNHTFVCSDLMDSTLLDEVLQHVSAPPTVVYCDPPWGQGLANGFRTKAGLGKATYDWTEIYRRVAGFAHGEPPLPLWVEGSVIESRWGMPIPGLITFPEGPTHRRYWQVTYFGGNASGLYYAGAQEAPDLDLSGKAGFAVTTAVLQHYGSGVVLDPCAGLGGVQLVAQKVGFGSVSNELSQYRTSKAIYRMVQATGQEAQKW